MRHSARTTTPPIAEEALGASPERRQHDPVEVCDIRDPQGWPIRVQRTVDTLGRLKRAGLVDGAQIKAGNRFRARFHRAQLDPGRVPDIARVPGVGRPPPEDEGIADAKEEIWQALQALGGIHSAAGSAVWWVVGCGFTVRDWTQRQALGRGVALRHEVATGILVGALAALAAHYARIDAEARREERFSFRR